jgi:hypothetical protein
MSNDLIKWPDKAGHIIIFPLIISVQYLHIHFLISILSFRLHFFSGMFYGSDPLCIRIPLPHSCYKYGIYCQAEHSSNQPDLVHWYRLGFYNIQLSMFFHLCFILCVEELMQCQLGRQYVILQQVECMSCKYCYVMSSVSSELRNHFVCGVMRSG